MSPFEQETLSKHTLILFLRPLNTKPNEDIALLNIGDSYLKVPTSGAFFDLTPTTTS